MGLGIQGQLIYKTFKQYRLNKRKKGKNMENNIAAIEVGKLYKFDDLIVDSIPTRFGEMNILKLVKGEEIVDVVKAPRQLLKLLSATPSATSFCIKKVILDGEYKNYVIDVQ